MHGFFKQRADNHLSGKRCPGCRIDKSREARLTNPAEFIDKAHDVHGLAYDYSLTAYTRDVDNIRIICPVHGEFSQQAGRHLQGAGCPKCGLKKCGRYASVDTADFIARATQLHGMIYDYSQSEYSTARGMLKIICPEHGLFLQPAGNHLHGKGCQKCGATRVGWTRSGWLNLQKDRKATLYIIYLFNETESFYKIGITYHSMYGRFRKSLPYQFRTVALYKSYNAGKVYDLEKQLHRELKQCRHKPLLSFGGQTECFTNVAPALASLPPDTFFLKWAKERLAQTLNVAA